MKNNNEDVIDFQEIVSETLDKEIDNASYKINTYGADFTLEVLSKKIKEKEIIVPPFQRRYVWPEKKASKLIESFLLGLPIPQVFLYRQEDTQDLLVVDGQQRLKSIHYFYEGKYEDGKEFILRGVKTAWEGKSYSELSEPDRRRFKNSILRATIFEQTDPRDKTSVFEIFERLNTGGMALTEQEIRNCVIRGKINSFLEDLNQHKSWRNLLGKQRPDSRMRDVEMILRFFSLFFGWNTYKKPMKYFISDFMEVNKNLNKKLRSKDGELFKSVMDLIYREVGSSAFKIKAGINVAVMDSIAVGLASIKSKKIKKISERYNDLINDKKYLEMIEKSTTDTDRVKGRIKIAIQYFTK